MRKEKRKTSPVIFHTKIKPTLHQNPPTRPWIKYRCFLKKGRRAYILYRLIDHGWETKRQEEM